MKLPSTEFVLCWKDVKIVAWVRRGVIRYWFSHTIEEPAQSATALGLYVRQVMPHKTPDIVELWMSHILVEDLLKIHFPTFPTGRVSATRRFCRDLDAILLRVRRFDPSMLLGRQVRIVALTLQQATHRYVLQTFVSF